jgi:protein-S-isoprenylcysteine O-methyltransferase Ste14
MIEARTKGVDIKLLVLELAGAFVVFALALFIPAGTFKWITGWSFLILFFGFAISMVPWLLKHDPGLLQERITGLGKPDQTGWDKVLMSLTMIFFVEWLILMPLDAVRFQWSHMPIWIQVVGAMILLASFYLIYLVYRENPYLSPAIRIQKERGQMVISTGLYHYVRHPLYAAFIPFFLCTALLLGSWCGILFGLVLVGLIAIRALLEERMLLKELEGYDTYMAQVKYRFIPYVW